MLLAGCGGGGSSPRAESGAAPPSPPAFAIGIDEKNPHLLAPGPQPAPFARFRDALAALQPVYVRVLVDWSVVQPAAGAPPDWTLARDGCARTAAAVRALRRHPRHAARGPRRSARSP